MMKISILKKFAFWLNCARVYTLPITVLNWLVAFVFSLKHGGNAVLGILALVGISFAHMAANLLDDYFDYKILLKDEKFLNSAQNCKCWYLKNNQVTVDELRRTIIAFLACAAVIGAILFLTSGYYVVIFAIIGLVISLTYQKFSLNGIGELAVMISFGPLLYEGTYYVMTGSLSQNLLLLSFACVFFTISILYVHMLMDYDGDECSHKKTLCRFFKTKEKALRFLTFFYLLGFVNIIFLGVLSANLWYLLTLLTLPLIFDLYISLINFNNDKTDLPQTRFWHAPLDNWAKIKETTDAPFYFRFFYVRNITTWFMILTCIAILFR